LRMVDDERVTALSDSWSSHLSLAVDSRDEHNSCRNSAAVHWNSTNTAVLVRADLSIDYAKQAFLPVVPSGTIGDFFVEKQGLDINMFGIMNEGSGLQTTMLSTEGALHDTKSVVSQLHLYLTNLDKRAGGAKVLYLHMDSCGGQNKNNIMLGYCLLRVIKGLQQRIVMKFMTVCHTKFGPDCVFGSIRTNMERCTALDLPQFSKLVDEASKNSKSYVFNHRTEVRDFKSGTRKLFKNLPGFRSKFYYCIAIERDNEDGSVLVRTSTNPGEKFESIHDLQKPATAIP